MKNEIKKKNIFIYFLNYIRKIFRIKKKEKEQEKNSDDIYPMW